EEKLKIEHEKALAKQDENIIAEQNRKKADEADKKALQKQFAEGTPEDRQKARLALKNQYGVDVETAEQMATKDEATKNAAMQEKMYGEALTRLSENKPLTFGDRVLLKAPVDELSAYTEQVGPGKRFATNMQAVKQYHLDQA